MSNVIQMKKKGAFEESTIGFIDADGLAWFDFNGRAHAVNAKAFSTAPAVVGQNVFLRTDSYGRLEVRDYPDGDSLYVFVEYESVKAVKLEAALLAVHKKNQPTPVSYKLKEEFIAKWEADIAKEEARVANVNKLADAIVAEEQRKAAKRAARAAKK